LPSAQDQKQTLQAQLNTHLQSIEFQTPAGQVAQKAIKELPDKVVGEDVAIISIVLGFMVTGASARLDQAAVNRDITDMETLLGARKALWARKVSDEVAYGIEVKAFSSATVPPGNGAKLLKMGNLEEALIANNNVEFGEDDQEIRFDISKNGMTDWLNASEQLSGYLPDTSCRKKSSKFSLSSLPQRTYD
jgi:hypothetical protein